MASYLAHKNNNLRVTKPDYVKTELIRVLRCQVHKRWLSAIRNQKIPSEESFADLDATEAELSLTPSYNRVLLTRLRVSIKVIPKSERMVRRSVGVGTINFIF